MYKSIFIIVLVVNSCSFVEAAEWNKCSSLNNQQLNKNIALIKDQHPQAIYLEANEGTLNPNGLSVLSGDVSLIKNDVYLKADDVRFQRSSEQISAKGDIHFIANGLTISADQLNYQLKKEKGVIDNAHYQLNQSSANGSSARAYISKTQTTLVDASFTTCSPKNPSWKLTAKKIVLNQQFKIGIARDLVFKAGNIPLLYFPYLSFPLDNHRKSGLLIPDLQMTQSSGLEFTLPYYFNLAANYDLTLSPAITTQGRLRLGGEFRYLSRKSKGHVGFDLIPKDTDYNDQLRGYIEVKHQLDISQTLRLSIDAKDVSDKDYLDDYSVTLNEASIAALPRRFDLVNKTKNWQIGLSTQDYQILDSNNAPYSRLPEIRVTYQPEKTLKQLRYSVEGEVVKFEKEGSINGIRSDLHLRAAKRFGHFSWYVEPAIGLRHSWYNLNYSTPVLTRILPTLSIDSALFFERKFDHSNYLQTLEPRLFYTYTPYKKQSHFPLFDSAAMSLGTSTKMFSTNRFSGKDRIADTNRLTAAITTRLFDTTKGTELLTASIGQIYYFDDRKVFINEGNIGDTARSEIAIELMGKFNNTKLIANTYWDTERGKINSGEIRLHYKNNKHSVANLSLRHLANEVDQLGMSFATPINEQLLLIGKVDYDLERERNLEQLIGFEYGTCCWKTRIGARRYLTSDNDSYDTGVFLEFELKGLGNIGNGTKHLLEEKVYGYEK